MTIYWIYVFACLLSVCAALISTPVVKKIALKFNCLDQPCDRKIHRQPMVRLGGVAIFGATVFPILCFWFGGALGQFSSVEDLTLRCLLLGGCGFFLIGFADDLFDISPFNRLWMQVIVAAFIWYFGISINTVVIPGFSPFFLGWLSLPVTVLWITGVVNAINWMDGLDGLAAGVTGIATIVLVTMGGMLSQPVVGLFGAALLGSLLGFLSYNCNPANIFMGDGGSYFIGYVLASLCVVGPNRLDADVSTLLPLVILAVPLSDMLSVIVARLYRGKSPFFADNRHFHHRLLQLGFSHRETVLIVYLVTATTSSLAFLMVNLPYGWLLWASLLAISILFLGLGRTLVLTRSRESTAS